MRTTTSLLAFLFISLTAFAQPIADASYTDCNNVTTSIYDVLGSGKVLLVANAGTNCSICMSHANSVGDVADDNPSTIAVWGAMTTKTGGNVNCTSINSWVSTYGWGNVFAFADNNKEWFSVGTPRYHVVSPLDSTVVYAGSNWNTAKQTAENLASQIIGIDENEFLTYVQLNENYFSIGLQQPVENLELSLYSITGQQLMNTRISTGQTDMKLDLNQSLTPGIYLLYMRAAGKEVVKKLML